MKLKAVAAVCRSNKTLVICRQDGRQLVGNGHALYDVRGLPEMMPEEVLRMFDVKETQISNWYIPDVRMEMPYNFRDDADEEEELYNDLPAIQYLGDFVQPLHTEAGEIIFVDKNLLKPIDGDMTRYFLRRKENGERYVVIKDGFLFEALIMPYDMITSVLCEKLEKLWRACKEACIAKPKETTDET